MLYTDFERSLNFLYLQLCDELKNLRDKEKALKAAQDNRSVTYKAETLDWQKTYPQTPGRPEKDWHDIFRALSEKNMQPKTL